MRQLKSAFLFASLTPKNTLSNLALQLTIRSDAALAYTPALLPPPVVYSIQALNDRCAGQGRARPPRS